MAAREARKVKREADAANARRFWKWPREMAVTTTGISCRMGVGGRRGRKRQPAKLRKARAFAESELSVCEKLMRLHPVSPKEREALTFRVKRIERRRAASAPSAGASSP